MAHSVRTKNPPWYAGNVSAKSIPEMVRRTHLEHNAMRALFTRLQPASIAEFGCGYGRLLPVAEEFTQNVAGLERAPDMVKSARKLFPGLHIVEQRDLGKVPLGDQSYEMAYSFTVLQHMSDQEAIAAIAEMKRVASRWVLIVEDTDPNYRRRPHNPVYFTIGRSVEWYTQQMAGWKLADIRLRPNEPGFTYRDELRPFSAHYMLFERPA